MLHLAYLSNKKASTSFFEIKDSYLDDLEDAFEHLKKITGVYIDPYGTTRVYPDHQKILICFLEKSDKNKHRRLINYLMKSVQSDEVVLFDGD